MKGQEKVTLSDHSYRIPHFQPSLPMGEGSITPRHWQWHYGGPDVLSPEEEAELEAGDEEFQEFHEICLQVILWNLWIFNDLDGSLLRFLDILDGTVSLTWKRGRPCACRRHI